MAVLQQSLVALKSQPSASPRISTAVRSFSLRCSPSIAPPSLRLSAARSANIRRPRHGGATMMDTAASRYAVALADVAKSNGTLDATSSDMEKVAKVFSEPGVMTYFVNPTVEVEKKLKMVEEIASASSLQPHTSNFLKILVDVRRTDLMREIVKEFETAYNKITGTELAVVTSVVRLESTHLAQIAKAVQRMTGAKNVRIRTVIDPSLVAGFTVRYGPSESKLIDMSVRKQLDEIASQLEFPDLSLASAS